MIYFTMNCIFSEVDQRQSAGRARSFKAKPMVEYQFTKARNHRPYATDDVRLLLKDTSVAFALSLVQSGIL